jgi:deoxyinosine 3'endonuclease (endonuclease V)
MENIQSPQIQEKASDVETVIIRNSTCKMLYDVVRVDYMKEEIEYVAKFLEFKEAVAMIEE